MLKSRLHVSFLVVIGALVGVTYLTGAQARSAGPQGADDKTIVTNIQSSLFTDPVLKTLNIHVASQGGVVTLSGTVNTNAEKADVERIASEEPGVKQVVDNLTVSGRSSGGTSVSSSRAASAHSHLSVTVPAGTLITVQMIDAVDSAKNKPGDNFNATVYSPVVVGNYLVIPRYSNAQVRLVNSNSAGHIRGRSTLMLELVSVTANGTVYEVESNYYDLQGKSRGKQTAERVAGGGGFGALVGGILGRGEGAAIGAAVGAATGAGAQEATRGQQVKVPSEARIHFILKAPVTITSVGPAAATGSAPPAVLPSTNGLSGTWVAHLQGAFGSMRVSITQTGLRLVGTIVGGDSTITSYIPVGKMVFYGSYSPNGFGAQEICAGLNYTSPYWQPVRFTVIDNSHLQEDLAGGRGCTGFPIIWERAR